MAYDIFKEMFVVYYAYTIHNVHTDMITVLALTGDEEQRQLIF